MTSSSGQPADILLVEDNPGDARLAEEAFKDAGLPNALHVVTDGEEALEFVYQRSEYAECPRPDVVFLDWNLPKVSGEEVLVEIKSNPNLVDIRVIALLGSHVEEDIVEPDSHQPDAFIAKPVEATDFRRAVGSMDE